MNQARKLIHTDRLWWFMQTTSSTQTVSGQSIYTLPTDMRIMQEVRIDGRVIDPIPQTDIFTSYKANEGNYRTGTYKGYWIFGDSELHLTPAPSQSHTTITLSSLTRTSTTATATTPSAHGYLVNDYVVISGANQSDYNGTFRVTSVPTTTTFTYTVNNSPATPATGTITVTKNDLVYRYYKKSQKLLSTSEVLLPDEFTDLYVHYVIYKKRGSLRGKWNIAKDAAQQFNDLLIKMRQENNKVMYEGRETTGSIDRDMTYPFIYDERVS